MRRTSWLRLAALLVVVVVGAGAFRLAYHNDPILRTIPIGFRPDVFTLDEAAGRLYILTADPQQALTLLDTRTGTPLPLPGLLGTLPRPPAIDHRSGHAFAIAFHGQYLMLDPRRWSLLKTLSAPADESLSFLDTPDGRGDRQLLSVPQAERLLVVDGASGAVLRQVQGCLASGWLTVSRSTGRFFEPCTDGSLAVFDDVSYRPLARWSPVNSGTCSLCHMLVDEQTRRLFVPADTALGVYDARSGAPIAQTPVQSWRGGSLALLPGGRAVVAVPYTPPGQGAARHAVLVLDGRTGIVQARWAVPQTPLAVQVNPLTGHVLVLSAGPLNGVGEPLGNGRLSVLDAGSGRLLGSVEMGLLPGLLIADRQSRHLFVVNYNASVDLSVISHPYPDGTWPEFLRTLKARAGWLPFAAPSAPLAPGTASVMMLDLTQL
jgi:hypothetical protein